MPSDGGLGFGPFRLDVREKHLIRGRDRIALSTRHHTLLLELLSHAGQVVTKRRLMDVGWPDVTVTDNNLVKAITQLRRTLDDRDPESYIRTASRIGYRFVVPVTPVGAPPKTANANALAAPDRALGQGRAKLEIVGRASTADALATYREIVLHHPDDPSAHIGLANALAMQFETTRADVAPDMDALRQAEIHARKARDLDPARADAWAVLGFVLGRAGERDEAAAMLRHALKLDPDNWRHCVQLAAVVWGEQRLQTARRAYDILQSIPMAYWLAASVFVARGKLTDAEREVDAGLAAATRQAALPMRFPAGGLHLLKGLLCFARGAEDDALASFERELALEAGDELYARESCANACCGIGAVHLRRGNRDAARAAFDQALARVPAHPMAQTGLAIVAGQPILSDDDGAAAALAAAARDGGQKGRHAVDVAIARAAGLVAAGHALEAARLIETVLVTAPPGNAAWLAPIEPLLDVQRDRATWAAVLTQLQTRAK